MKERQTPILAEGLHGRVIRSQMPRRTLQEAMDQVRRHSLEDGDPRVLQRMLDRGQITAEEFKQAVKPSRNHGLTGIARS